MSRSTFSVLFYVNRGKEKGGTTRLSVSGRVPRHCARCGDGWHQALRSAREMATSKHCEVIGSLKLGTRIARPTGMS